MSTYLHVTHMCVSVCTYLYMSVEWRVDPFVIKKQKTTTKTSMRKNNKGNNS